MQLTQRESMNPCYLQLNFFACYIMNVTYSYQHFSAFQMSILLLQFELNLNSFLYFNNKPTIMIVANFNHHSCITLITHHMITIEIDMYYVYYMNSNSIFWIHLMLIPNNTTFNMFYLYSYKKRSCWWWCAYHPAL